VQRPFPAYLTGKTETPVYYLVMVPAQWFLLALKNRVFTVPICTLMAGIQNCCMVDETLQANGLQKSDIDWLVPHQANLRIIKATAKKLAMTLDNVVVTVQDHGNTSAASIPLALDVAVRDGRIKRGEKLLLEGFGGGFTWGSALITY